ncbi:Colicin V production protein [Brevundimonas sp. SH203]|uniref:CvpA family protein n=1 Tax=Brevundimonas sp. SH203 TaxID=345167 RepID=UPI0009CDA2AE|nr:CvpA family protein [Brevundimonas sp. SH203]GAW40235.1 Colicin V production protein [Brevundimonas sp. SH203]
MTGYDVFVIVVILFSVAAGWVRGGVREVITLLSATLAALIALIALPWTAGVARAFVDPEWAGSILAAVLTFFVVYFGLRLIGGMLSKGAEDHPHLGMVNRLFGFVIGAVRALVLIGAVHLVIAAALPGERTPRWLTDAALYPVSAVGARMIQIVLPSIGRGADAITPVVDSSVRRGFSDDEALPPTQSRPNSPREAAR